MSSDDATFFDRLRADPHDDGPRLIYADWLDEHGDPAHAEFIRLQCALAALPDDDPQRPALVAREAALWEANEGRWAAPLAGLVTAWEFRRGVIDSVSVDTEQFLSAGRPIFDVAPVRKVRFVDVGPHLADLARSPLLGLVRELDLVGNNLGGRKPRFLAGSPHLDRLEALDLGFTDLTDRGLEVLAGSPVFGNLRSLHINDNPRLAAAGLRAVAHSPYLADLIDLDVSGNNLADAALRPLLAISRLRTLTLHGNRLGDAGTIAFVNALVFGRMAATGRIDLRRVEMGPAGARALADSPALADVDTLILDNNSIGDDGLRALAESPHAGRLRVLSLRENRLSDDGARALARSPVLATLRRLDLTGNLITQASQERLHEASVNYDWRGLLELRADANQLTRPTPAYARGLPL